MITLGLIGAGRWGSNIRRTLAGLHGCQLKYVETRGWRKLLGARDLDGVLIATPALTHALVAEPFIQRRIPTFIEKPMTTSLRDALRLQRLQERSKSLVFVGHVHLYNPAYEKAKSLARTAGRIRYLLAEGMSNGPYRDDISALWDWAPHDLALAMDLLGTEPREVQAAAASFLRPHTRLYDFGTLHLRFPNNVHFFGTKSRLSPEKRKRLTIVCEKDTIVFDDTAERKVTLFRSVGPVVHGRTISRQEPTISHPPYGSAPSLTHELKAFISCIRTGRKPLSGIVQGVATVRILDAAERSLKKKGALVGV